MFRVKVYVVQETNRHNILSAEKFGELRFLLNIKDQIGLSSSGPFVVKMKRGLSDFTSEDFLLLIGDPAACAVATSIASEKTNGRYNLLKWDRMEGRYFPIKVDLNLKGESYDWFNG